MSRAPSRRSRTLFLLAAMIATAVLAAPAPAAPPRIPGAPTTAAMPQRSAVSVSAAVWPERVAPGSRAVIAITMDHDTGYHTWPPAGLDVLPKEIAEFAIRTGIEIDAQPAWLGLGAIQWPALHDNEVPDLKKPGRSISVPTFSGRAVTYLPIRIAADAPSGEYSIAVTASWQACDESQCLPPDDATSAVKIVIDAAAPATNFDERPALYSGLDAGAARAALPPTAGNGTGSGAPRQPSDPNIFGYGLAGTSGALALVVLFLAAALGGFVLNLMPCVLPMIPIKILTLTQHAGSRRKAIVLGAWTSIGVVSFWVALGIVAAAFRGSIGDPSRQIFGLWWVALGVGVLLVVLGLGAMGIFQFKLPQGAYMLNPDPNRAWGSFLFGVMTALLGLPCFGFAAGGLLIGMAAMPVSAVLVIFFGIGVGMALPYSVLSAFPGFLKKVPKAGPASDLIKQVMGLLLLGGAAFFVSVGVYQLTVDHPWITTNLKWVFATLFISIAGVWLIVRSLQVSKKPLPIAFGLILGAALIGFFVWFTVDSASKAHHDWKLTAGLSEGDYAAGAWNEYNPERMARARADGKVVVIDFTAEWCINCKAYKRAVLESATVRGRLAMGDVVTFEGDVTSKRSPAQALMDEWGQTGIPLLVVLGPGGGSEPQFSNSAPASVVVEMIDRAAGKTAAGPGSGVGSGREMAGTGSL